MTVRTRLDEAIDLLLKVRDAKGAKQRWMVAMAARHLIAWLAGRTVFAVHNAVTDNKDYEKKCDRCFRRTSRESMLCDRCAPITYRDEAGRDEGDQRAARVEEAAAMIQPKLEALDEDGVFGGGRRKGGGSDPNRLKTDRRGRPRLRRDDREGWVSPPKAGVESV